ncbi:MAG: hypothetical protein ABII22_02750 [Candidatus Micrarchaeota archaeon]
MKYSIREVLSALSDFNNWTRLYPAYSEAERKKNPSPPLHYNIPNIKVIEMVSTYADESTNSKDLSSLLEALEKINREGSDVSPLINKVSVKLKNLVKK